MRTGTTRPHGSPMEDPHVRQSARRAPGPREHLQAGPVKVQDCPWIEQRRSVADIRWVSLSSGAIIRPAVVRGRLSMPSGAKIVSWRCRGDVATTR